jgi:hypothetical protein
MKISELNGYTQLANPKRRETSFEALKLKVHAPLDFHDSIMFSTTDAYPRCNGRGRVIHRPLAECASLIAGNFTTAAKNLHTMSEKLGLDVFIQIGRMKTFTTIVDKAKGTEAVLCNVEDGLWNEEDINQHLVAVARKLGIMVAPKIGKDELINLIQTNFIIPEAKINAIVANTSDSGAREIGTLLAEIAELRDISGTETNTPGKVSEVYTHALRYINDGLNDDGTIRLCVQGNQEALFIKMCEELKNDLKNIAGVEQAKRDYKMTFDGYAPSSPDDEEIFARQRPSS